MTNLRPEATGKKICANSGAVASPMMAGDPLAFSIEDFCRITSTSPEAVFAAIKSGAKISASSSAVANLAQGTAPQSALAHSIDDVTRITSSGRTAVFHAIKIGDLKARKLGRRTVILDHDLRAWLASLPLAGQSCSAA